MSEPPSPRSSRTSALVGWTGCWLLFVVFSFLRVPIPGINEPHYLGMAKAVWNPQWCPGDPFYASATPHRAFYLLLGPFTRFLTLEQVAILGRFSSLSLAAWGWMRLARSLGLSQTGGWLAAALFLLIQSTGSWSGEWLIGGVESKVFAYGLVFAAWGAMWDRRTASSACWLGLATTMHPIVGVWATLTTIATLAIRWWRQAAVASEEEGPLPPVPIQPSAIVWWFVCAAPGLGWAIPALKSADSATSALADFIQVSHRLAHHLDPWIFATKNHLFFAALIVVWQLLARRRSSNDRWNSFDTLSITAVSFGLIATLLSAGPRPWSFPPTAWQSLQLMMLKFYPFRLADVMVAVSASFAIVATIRLAPKWWFAELAAAIAALVISLSISGPDQHPGGLAGTRRNDWITTLTWIDRHAPPDALLYAVNEDFAVKWYAQRAEYVSFKDCPQDARGVVEWNRRLNLAVEWTEACLANDRHVDEAELKQLRQQTGITHLIVSDFGPMTVPPTFEQGHFRVFELPR